MSGSIFFVDVAYWRLVKNLYNFRFKEERLPLYLSDIEKGVGYSYAKSFQRAGWKVHHVYVNDLPKQYSWLSKKPEFRKLKQTIDKILVNRKWNNDHLYLKYLWLFFGLKITRLQIEEIEPDFLWNFDPINFPLLPRNKMSNKIIKIAQIGSPIKSEILLKNYSSIITSHPEYLQEYSQKFKNTYLIKAAFDKEHYIRSNWLERPIMTSFVGSISRSHVNRLNFLEELSQKIELKTFGFGFDTLSPISKLRGQWGGEVWGQKYYDILSKTRVSINYHADFVKNNSTNLRIFESTGMGTILLTNHTKDLEKIFEIDVEVISFKNLSEAKDKIDFIMKNPSIGQSIADAGRNRTHISHNYDVRTSEILQKVRVFN